MNIENKKIEEFLENKITNSSQTIKTSDDFTGLLMKRITAENNLIADEARNDKIARNIIISFVSLIVVMLGLIVFSSGGNSNDATNSNTVKIQPAVQTSNDMISQMLTFFKNIFLEVFEFLGLNLSFNTFMIFLIIIAVVAVFMLVEKLVVRSKLKSSTESR